MCGVACNVFLSLGLDTANRGQFRNDTALHKARKILENL